MKRLTIHIYLVLGVALLLTELHSVLYFFYPDAMRLRVDLFLTREPIVIYEDGVPGLVLQWYIKAICDSLFLISVFFCFSMVAFRMSVAIFFLVAILLMYQLIDFFLFLYNYKRSAGTYWIIIASVLAAGLTILRKRRMYEYISQYKSMI